MEVVFKLRFYPFCLDPSAPQWSRMESNHRFLGVDQVSLPLDHGTVSFQVESPGVAPGTDAKRCLAPACGAGVVLLDHDPVFPKAEAVGLEPTSGFSRHLFSRQAPHPAGWLPWSSCGGWS